jgi:heptosyltransferase-2
LPAIAALRRQFPQAHLEVLGYPHIAQLALVGGLVNRVQSIEAGALAGFFARGGELAENLADYFSEFDLILSYLYDPDAIFQTNVGRCTGAQFIVGPHRVDEAARLHAAKVYLQPLERLAIFDADPIPRLPLASPPRSINYQLSTINLLALHPGSGSERKNWPEAKWAELLQYLVSSTEFDLLLAELAGRLAVCRAFVGHDSGISHLAAAVGLTGLVLWGDTAEEIWRPPSEKMMVLRHPAGLDRLAVAEVVAQLWRVLVASCGLTPGLR